ncbi:MAG: tetratricopeptide repeat protein [Planctomycetota bacterium]
MRYFLLITLLSTSCVFGEVYTSEHFEVISDLDSRYIEILQNNIEGYYDNMTGRFFGNGWDRPLSIYYFENQSDTQAYFGDQQKIYYGLYMPSKNAIYTHRKMDKGGLAGLGTVFHEITHHFVRLNFNNPPTWFNEGITCFLSEQSRLVKGHLKVGHPNLWREQALREMIESGMTIDVKYYTSLNGDAFYQDRKNYHPIRALFYWIYSIGKLEEYLQNVQHQGYALSVLENTVGMNATMMNDSLLAFIQQYCYAGAYVQDHYSASTFEAKEAMLKAALNLYPEYSRARLELGKLYFSNEESEKCQEALLPLLNNNQTVEYKDANLYLAKCYYNQKDMMTALTYYHEALDYSLCEEYHYQICFWIGNCYASIGDKEKGRLWLGRFLNDNWEPERLPKWCEFAQKYLDTPSS